MPQKDPCAFCEINPADSVEDVIAKWFLRQRNALNIHIKRKMSYEGEIQTSIGNAGVLAECVCGPCNHGWMSRLENQAKPIFGKLDRGFPATISSEDAVILSRWMFKTAVTYEYAKAELSGINKRYFLGQERHRFFHDFSFPIDMRVFATRLAYKDQPSEFNLFNSKVTCTYSTGTKLFRFSGYVFTFVVDQLVLQLFTARRPPEIRNEQISFRFKYDWSRFEISLYPNLSSSRWPPEYALTRIQLNDFADRFDKDG
jgi:hypothetical protein